MTHTRPALEPGLGGGRPFGWQSHATRRATAGFFVLLAGSLAGTAAQLMQPGLWPIWGYGCLVLAAVLLVLLLMRVLARQPTRTLAARMLLALLVLLAGALLGAAQTGLRAAYFERQALPGALEGRDLLLTGVVAQMPQRHDTGLRFHFKAEMAQLLSADGAAGPGTAVAVPDRLALSWYTEGSWGAASPTPAPAQPPVALHAGERWQFVVRLKAPHGSRNPHGFDHELWLWEQDVQATGHVRSTDRRAPPLQMGQSWQHPVERAREAVRDAILARADGLPEDPARARALGVVAALVTGDQAAIERADWDVFRATGIAHLMSISGLHITLLPGLLRPWWARCGGAAAR